MPLFRIANSQSTLLVCVLHHIIIKIVLGDCDIT